MKIEHNIALSVDRKAKADFANLGIDLEDGFSNFKICESDERWPQVSKLAKQYEAIDTATTKFTTQELKSADNLTMSATWHHGYPEPSDDNGFIGQVYDTSDYCPSCGTGLNQKSPFKMKGEPKWGAKGILQLNWVFEDFFVKPQVWKNVFQPFGIGCKDVLNAKSNKPLETVVQLIIPDSVNSFDLENYPYETCSKCGIDKFFPITRGWFPSLKVQKGDPMFKAKNYFGSGANARKMVVVSQEMYLSIQASKLKGVYFTPLRKVKIIGN
jgi:hypothetical protein